MVTTEAEDVYYVVEIWTYLETWAIIWLNSFINIYTCPLYKYRAIPAIGSVHTVPPLVLLDPPFFMPYVYVWDRYKASMYKRKILSDFLIKDLKYIENTTAEKCYGKESGIWKMRKTSLIF